ncbi:3-beta-hydroxysteroid sulfotransferase-like [Watersipora subatra]|uniref:3-beta-hydroxysteroid sulfotransferase-like n=1 Tax=Watersipora subatra TaxID=2589382 RepID=UPI00355C2A9D
MTISTFMKRLGAAVVVGHAALITGLHFYKKRRRTDSQSMFQKRTEEDKLLSWLSQRKGVYLVKDIAANVDKLDKHIVRDDDVYVVSYPKSGTTWLSEIVYNIVHGLNFTEAQSLPLDERVPYLEWVHTDSSTLAAMSPSYPRVIKSHLPLSLIPPKIRNRKCKIIYIMRNPRDVCVSYYYFTKMIQLVGYKGHFADFFQLFLQGQVSYGSWCSHVKEFWEARSEANVLFLTYEQLSKNPQKMIEIIGEFLEKSLSPEQVNALMKYCSFDQMQSNPASNYSWLRESGFTQGGPFLRKGVVGDWREHFNSEMIASLDTQVNIHLSDSSLRSIIEYI